MKKLALFVSILSLLAAACNSSAPEQSRWTQALEYIKNCQVKQAAQAHSLEVVLRLKDDSTFSTKEPKIDAIFHELDSVKQTCGNIPIATE